MNTAIISFLVTGMTLCANFPVETFSMTLAQTSSLCTLSEFLQRALSDDRKSLSLSLYSFITLTGLVSIDPEKENQSLQFCGFLSSVYRILVTYGYTERTYSHPQSGSGAVEEEDLVANKVPLKEYCSKFNNTDE